MSYVIAGRKIGAEWLSIATLTTFFGGVAYAVSGSPSTKTTEELKKAMPPIDASSKDEESFILNFIKEEEEKAKSALPVPAH
ncbi:hypothetical protein BCR37DRAFT_395462 [Protomyces lactucae-debilis]|uniref:ATP synthase subunit K, mitochondrial n=1 Tax=Protomyces lactucae-debilis TaxID=2754530 RepID=A0A1Y2EVZ8_PROLT|nr:uncharacterized protein BCR37DRAFT_395462 [Protomyces lactucae-debilis]ORY75781.1 hypothetical protein BCR37DRAFT_395462 [Protomyces lactucae-debilis]